MRYYDVDGYDRPLLLSEEHAEALGATEHQTTTERPNRAASKADWAAYAVGVGGDPTVVESMTRADLIEQYGG